MPLPMSFSSSNRSSSSSFPSSSSSSSFTSSATVFIFGSSLSSTSSMPLTIPRLLSPSLSTTKRRFSSSSSSSSFFFFFIFFIVPLDSEEKAKAVNDSITIIGREERTRQARGSKGKRVAMSVRMYVATSGNADCGIESSPIEDRETFSTPRKSLNPSTARRNERRRSNPSSFIFIPSSFFPSLQLSMAWL